MSAIIFDLDNCLAAATEVGEALFAPAFDAVRAANAGALSELQLQAAFDDCWRCPLDWVAAHHGFSEAMYQGAWHAFQHAQVDHPMHGYGDLDVLALLPAPLFLVTSGFRRLQESKIAALGVARHFAGIYIDAIDEPDRQGKQGLFAHILATQGLLPSTVLVVGDNPDAEIAAGNRLGMPTVQILRPGVARGDNARHYITSLHELADLARQQAAALSGGAA